MASIDICLSRHSRQRIEIAAGDRRERSTYRPTRSVRATKTPLEMMTEVEQKAGATAPPAPLKLTPADKEDVEQVIARLAAAEAGADPSR